MAQQGWGTIDDADLQTAEAALATLRTGIGALNTGPGRAAFDNTLRSLQWTVGSLDRGSNGDAGIRDLHDQTNALITAARADLASLPVDTANMTETINAIEEKVIRILRARNLLPRGPPPTGGRRRKTRRHRGRGKKRQTRRR